MFLNCLHNSVLANKSRHDKLFPFLLSALIHFHFLSFSAQVGAAFLKDCLFDVSTKNDEFSDMITLNSVLKSLFSIVSNGNAGPK